MDKTKHKGKSKKSNPKKGKSLIKLIRKSDSDSDESEHELSYYKDDRVKLMKEVLKIIKPKKIISMAPNWMKYMDIEEINSMLLEELLGLSNKRLKCIFHGQKQEEDTSSTDPEEDEKPIDIISLDDITDDDFIINIDSDEDGTDKIKKGGKSKVKKESTKRVKKEKKDKEKPAKKKVKSTDKNKNDEENLMSVLELLELQARARAIKSQLLLETQRKAEENKNKETTTEKESDNEEDAVIIESPKNFEIVITSSESENEHPEIGNSKESVSQHNLSEASKSINLDNNTANEACGNNGENRLEQHFTTGEPEIGTEKENKNKEDTEDVNQVTSQPNDIEQSKSDDVNIIKESDLVDNYKEKSGGDKKCDQGNESLVSTQSNDIQDTVKTSKQITITEQIIIPPTWEKLQEKLDKKRNRIYRKRLLKSTSDANSEEENKNENSPDCETDENSTCQDGKEPEREEPLEAEKESGSSKENDIDEDGILINVDQSEIDCIICD